MARYVSSGREVSMCVVAMALALLVLLGLKHCDAAAATFIVGDSNGWNINMKGWGNEKVFRAGDVLRFNYDQRIHNVVVVDEVGYRSCSATGGAKVFNSGKDEIKLATGHNFFICSLPGHCQAGMKIAISAPAL